jgi:translocation and assembly module TamA
VIGEIRFDRHCSACTKNSCAPACCCTAGEKFSPAAIERARKDLSTLGVFAAVTAQVGTAVDATGGVPITFDVSRTRAPCGERSARRIRAISAAASALWSDRDVLAARKQLTVSGSLINLGGSATTALGYNSRSSM